MSEANVPRLNASPADADIARLARTIAGTGNLPSAEEVAFLRGTWKGMDRVLGIGERRAGAHEARLEKIRGAS